MTPVNREETFRALRRQHPCFRYRGFDWRWTAARELSLNFDFEIEGGIRFTPRARLTLGSALTIQMPSRETMGRLVFHLGMILLVSYWKCACPPRVLIEAGAFSPEQIGWWKQLFFRGLGEFRYRNGIAAAQAEFVELVAPEDAGQRVDRIDTEDHVLIPVGGGKDSIVTLDLLRERPGNAFFAINPIPSALNGIRKVDPELGRLACLEAAIDPGLLALNRRGYLNGHTPFSALVAFGATLTAALTGARHISLSNEASASEGNTVFNGAPVNHQYSKSLEFERDFREYCCRWLAPGVNYFSLLRPLSELQIARAFAQLTEFHEVFNSCNRGGREGYWCGQCAKCLFTAIILAPWLCDATLKAIFGRNLLDQPALEPIFWELVGVEGTVKPFDCVGTPAEVRLALAMALEKTAGAEQPMLLRKFRARLGDVGVIDRSARAAFGEHELAPGFAVLARKVAGVSEGGGSLVGRL